MYEGNRYIGLLALFTLVMVLTIQVSPYFNVFLDIQMTEFLDLEESENDDKETEEETKEGKKFFSELSEFEKITSKSTRRIFSNFSGVPAAPCLETLSPPPDLA